MFAAPLEGYEFSVNATLAETWGDDYAVHASEPLGNVGVVEFFGVDIHEVEFVTCVGGCMEEGFVD